MGYADYLRDQDLTKSAMELIDAISSVSTSRVLSLVGTGFVVLVTIKIISAAFGNNSSNPGINTRGPQSGALKLESNSIENQNGSQPKGSAVSPRDI
jgi:hypothetical protein